MRIHETDDTGMGIRVTDEEYPGVVGIGRTLDYAERDFERRIRESWHTRRVGDIQKSLDRILAGVMIDKEELIEIQRMLDEFVSRLRSSGEHL